MEADLFRVQKDWKHILKKAASCWILYVTFILTVGQMLVTMGWEHGLIAFGNPWLYPILVGILTAATVCARIYAQKDFK